MSCPWHLWVSWDWGPFCGQTISAIPGRIADFPNNSAVNARSQEHGHFRAIISSGGFESDLRGKSIYHTSVHRQWLRDPSIVAIALLGFEGNDSDLRENSTYRTTVNRRFFTNQRLLRDPRKISSLWLLRVSEDWSPMCQEVIFPKWAKPLTFTDRRLLRTTRSTELGGLAPHFPENTICPPSAKPLIC